MKMEDPRSTKRKLSEMGQKFVLPYKESKE